jgi:hypothetical protein
MMPPFKIYRVRFCEWSTYAITLSASSPDNALEIAQAARDVHGTAHFEEIDGATDGWEAEEELHRALSPLDTVPRFKVDDEDGYAIAADLDCLVRNIKGGAL